MSKQRYCIHCGMPVAPGKSCARSACVETRQHPQRAARAMLRADNLRIRLRQIEAALDDIDLELLVEVSRSATGSLLIIGVRDELRRAGRLAHMGLLSHQRFVSPTAERGARVQLTAIGRDFVARVSA